MPEVGILIVDNDIASQRALKNVLDAEGWQVRIVPTASHALPELASGSWNLAIVNTSLIDLRGPIFAILRELAQADQDGQHADAAEAPAQNPSPDAAPSSNLPRQFRVLFLVPVAEAKTVQPVLERVGLPYSFKPYHLHDFLEKVSELLVESGAVEQSLRGIGDFSTMRKRRRPATARPDAGRGAMFASRADYQMTEEEMAEFERQETDDRKKREKDQRDRGFRY